MRLDKFLKVSMLIKRRTVAGEAASEGFIKVNGRTAKPGLKIKEGDVIELDMWNFYKKITVLTVPLKGSIPKAKIDEYIRVDEYRPKEPDGLL